jgi:hypothetical protein
VAQATGTDKHADEWAGVPGAKRSPEELLFEGRDPAAPTCPMVDAVVGSALRYPLAMTCLLASVVVLCCAGASSVLLFKPASPSAAGTKSALEANASAVGASVVASQGSIHWGGNLDKCVLVEGAVAKAGYSIIVSPCRDKPFGWIVPTKEKPMLRPALYPELCLDHPSGSKLQLWHCSEDHKVKPNLQFELHAVGNDTTRGTIRPATNSSLCVNVPADKQGTTLEIQPCIQDSASNTFMFFAHEGTEGDSHSSKAGRSDSLRATGSRKVNKGNGKMASAGSSRHRSDAESGRIRNESDLEKIKRVADAVKAKAEQMEDEGLSSLLSDAQKARQRMNVNSDAAQAQLVQQKGDLSSIAVNASTSSPSAAAGPSGVPDAERLPSVLDMDAQQARSATKESAQQLSQLLAQEAVEARTVRRRMNGPAHETDLQRARREAVIEGKLADLEAAREIS